MTQRIDLKGDFIQKERVANAAITPGDLIELMSTDKVRRHATVGGAAAKAFALDNDLIGKGIDDNYAAGDTVRYGLFPPGSEVYARLADGESCSIGDFLESGGEGVLQASSTAIEGSAVGIALEAISGGGGVQRVKIEVL